MTAPTAGGSWPISHVLGSGGSSSVPISHGRLMIGPLALMPFICMPVIVTPCGARYSNTTGSDGGFVTLTSVLRTVTMKASSGFWADDRLAGKTSGMSVCAPAMILSSG